MAGVGWAALWLLPTCPLMATVFFVSPGGDDGNPGTRERPFATITHARDVVAQVNGAMTEDITVYLRGGTYALTSPLVFDEGDSGTNGHKVTYKAFPGETPVISGGQVVTGWSIHDAGKNIYKASVGSLEFRQIYVNGTRAVRARYPDWTSAVTLAGYLTGASITSSAPYKLNVNSAELTGWETWGNLNEVEVVMVTHWKQKRARIESISGGTIGFQSPESSASVMYHYEQPGTPHWYENAYEFLDAVGEFYLNTQTDTLFYKPRAGENMTTAEVMIPTVQTLVDMQGRSPAKKVQNLVFEGITFQYSNWTEPNRKGFTTRQAATHYGAVAANIDYNSIVPGAIQLENADGVEIRSCTVRRTGAHGIIAVKDVVNDCSFVGNLVSDTSAGGIYLLLNDANSTGNMITDNTVEWIGMDYSNACGILVTRTPDLSILHNEVRDVRYTGISTGWQWNDLDTTAINQEVAYNRIHRTMGLHDDGGGIYTLGKIPGMEIHDNYIHSITRSPYAGNYGICGIYLDNGSSFKHVHHNVIDGVEAAFFAGNPPNHDNLFEWNHYTGTFANSMDPANTVQNNTQVTGSNWSAAALAIMDAAGPRVSPGPALVFVDYFADTFAGASGGAAAPNSLNTPATTANTNVSAYVMDADSMSVAAGVGAPGPALNLFSGADTGAETASFHLNLTTVPGVTYRVALQTAIWGSSSGNHGYSMTASAFDGSDTTVGSALGSDKIINGGYNVASNIGFTFEAQSTSTTIFFDGEKHATNQPGLSYSAATYGAETADATGGVDPV